MNSLARRTGLVARVSVLAVLAAASSASACVGMSPGAYPPVRTAAAEAPTAEAGTEPRSVKDHNLAKDGLAIQGYDPVAYFPEGGDKPQQGNKAITAEYRGATYRFASAEHRDLFLKNPKRYEPAYGGWCAWAMKDSEKVEVDPKSFIVKDDRLFLFYNGFIADTRSKWLKGDHNAEAATCDANWKKIAGEEKRAEPAKPAA